MDLLAKYNLDPRYYRIRPDRTLALRSPPACPNGHPFGPGRHLLSTTNRGGVVVHRWLCWECRAEWSSAPIEGAVVWPGVETMQQVLSRPPRVAVITQQ